MLIHIEIGEYDLKSLVYAHISKITGANITPDQVKIQVKSKQNYKSEWEEAAFRAIVETNQTK